MPEQQIAQLGALWNIQAMKLREDIALFGSPERTESRIALEDNQKQVFILECLHPHQVDRKQRIADVLQHLADQGLLVKPYLRSCNGSFIEEVEGQHWQIVEYVPGIDLPRPEYCREEWRGAAVAKFLSAMRTASASMPWNGPVEMFDLPAYIDHLLVPIKRNRPEILTRLLNVRDDLSQSFYPVYQGLPKAFCHGDLHAVNIIWGKEAIRAVIDWEFCGIKPELYDAANFIGCVGIEDPEYLVGPVVLRFIQELRLDGRFSKDSFQGLVDLIVGLRFAWVSEWLRKKDDEMLALELDYLELLSENKSALEQDWSV